MSIFEGNVIIAGQHVDAAKAEFSFLQPVSLVQGGYEISGFHVKVGLVSNDSILEVPKFELTISDSISIEWKIHRTYMDFCDLDRELRKSNVYLPALPPEIDFTTSLLQTYIRDLLGYFGEQIWGCHRLLLFLDDFYGQSQISRLQCTHMFQRVCSLENQLETAEARTTDLAGLVQDLSRRVSDLEIVDADTTDAGDTTGDPESTLTINALQLKSLDRLDRAGRLSRRSRGSARLSVNTVRSSVTSVLTSNSANTNFSIDSAYNELRAIEDLNRHDGRDDVATELSDDAIFSDDDDDGEFLFTESHFSPQKEGGSRLPPAKPPKILNVPTSVSQPQGIAITNSSSSVQSTELVSASQPPGRGRADSYSSVRSTGCEPPVDSNAVVNFQVDSQEDLNDVSALATALASAPMSGSGAAISNASISSDGSYRFPYISKLEAIWNSYSAFDINAADGDVDAELADLADQSSLQSSTQKQITSVLNSDEPVQFGYRTSQFFPPNIIPVNEKMTPCDNVVEDLVQMLQPHDEQFQHRGSIRGFIGRHVRRALGAKVFETGLHSLRCFLPDDGMKISVVLWRGHPSHWHVNLSERLCRLADGIVDPPDEVRDDEFMYGEYNELGQPLFRDHVISNVSASNTNGEHRFFSIIDAVPVEIGCDPRSDLCLLALFEEIAGLVDKEHLFKRSLLLIRAWWVYETSAYIGCPMKHYLSDFSLCVMVSAIFNQYHLQIYYPLQALSFFLAEYSDFDWSENAITLQGIVPFRTENESEPWMRQSNFGHVLSAQILSKYWQAFNSKSPPAPSSIPSATPVGPSTSAATGGAGTATKSDVSGTDADTARLLNQLGLNEPLPSPRNDTVPLSPREALKGFEKRAINIVHPLSHANMVTEKLNARRAKRIVKVFQMGARNLHTALRLVSAGSVSIQTSINSFFRNILSRFGNGWRPDIFGNSLATLSGEPAQARWDDHWSRGGSSAILTMPRSPSDSTQDPQSPDLMFVSIDFLWDLIHYCNLLLEGSVTEPALLVICKEILHERGTLPVGEVGKMLQELTSISNLSNKLKEKFGGLKKFLERYPDEFVISTDHPFNPHVFIRRMLSAEDLETISRGFVPAQLTAKFKKAAAAASKKSKGGGTGGGASSGSANTVVDYGPWSSQQGMSNATSVGGPGTLHGQKGLAGASRAMMTSGQGQQQLGYKGGGAAGPGGGANMQYVQKAGHGATSYAANMAMHSTGAMNSGRRPSKIGTQQLGISQQQYHQQHASQQQHMMHGQQDQSSWNMGTPVAASWHARAHTGSTNPNLPGRPSSWPPVDHPSSASVSPGSQSSRPSAWGTSSGPLGGGFIDLDMYSGGSGSLSGGTSGYGGGDGSGGSVPSLALNVAQAVPSFGESQPFYFGAKQQQQQQQQYSGDMGTGSGMESDYGGYHQQAPHGQRTLYKR